MNEFTSLVRDDLKKFQPYSSARKEATSGSIFLNANESPWNNFESLKNVKDLNRYPDPQPKILIEELANFYQTDTSQILITRGSDEAIDLLVRLFCYAGKDSVIFCPPTYGMYEISARLQGANIILAPLIKNAGFQIDLQKIKNLSDSSVKLIFLCSPNNPTGNLLDASAIFDLCKKFSNKTLVVVDEAYIEYAGSESFTQKIKEYKNLVVLRTFSKALGLAGARCGALISHPDLIAWLNKIIAPYPLSKLTVNLALQALSEKNLVNVKNQIESNTFERKKLMNFFSGCSWVKKIWPSQTNFLLMEVKDSKEILEKCLKNGIILRDMQNKKGLKNCIRVSIGSPDENYTLIKVLSG